MPNKIKNINTGKKYSYVRDDLGINGRGLYAFTPFSRLDKKNKTIVKIGLSTNLVKRDQSYMTTFPQGLYYMGFIYDINTKTALNKTGKNLEAHLRMMESCIFSLLKEKNIERLRTTLAIKDLDKLNMDAGGLTEWVYATPEDIHNVFVEVQKKYGGKTMFFSLDKKVLDEREDLLQKGKNTYVGEITFPTHQTPNKSQDLKNPARKLRSKTF